MARKKKKKSNKPKLSKEQQRFVDTRKKQKTKDLASLPSSNKTADNSGVVALDQIQGPAICFFPGHNLRKKAAV